MKKLCTVLASSALLLSLTGCGDAKAEPNDADSYLVEIDGEKITNEEVYNQLVAEKNVQPLQVKINQWLTEEVMKTTKEDEKQADGEIANLKKQLGDQFKDYLKYTGIKDEKQFKKEVVIPSIKLRKLPNKYFNEDYKNLSEEYKLKKLQIIYTNNSDTAKKIEKELEKEKFDFEKVAKKYSETDAFPTETKVYSKEDSIPEEVWEEISDLDNGDVSKVIKVKANHSYMAVKVVNDDPEKFKKDGVNYFIDLANKQQQVQQQMASQQAGSVAQDGELNAKAFRYFLDKCGFEVHDIDVYNALVSTSKRYEEK